MVGPKRDNIHATAGSRTWNPQIGGKHDIEIGFYFLTPGFNGSTGAHRARVQLFRDCLSLKHGVDKPILGQLIGLGLTQLVHTGLLDVSPQVLLLAPDPGRIPAKSVACYSTGHL